MQQKSVSGDHASGHAYVKQTHELPAGDHISIEEDAGQLLLDIFVYTVRSVGELSAIIPDPSMRECMLEPMN